MEPIHVYLIHGYRLLTEAVARSCRARPEIRLLGSTQNLDQLLAQLPELPVDLALIDLSIGDNVALEIVRDIRETLPELKTLPLGLRSEEQVLEFLEAGASGYVLRDASTSEFLHTIEAVNRGEPPCSARIATCVCDRIAELAHRKRQRHSAPVDLTPRQTEVLQLIAEGMRNKEIAGALAITLPTVKNHVHRLLEKLHADSRRQAILRAYENGLLEHPFPQPPRLRTRARMSPRLDR